MNTLSSRRLAAANGKKTYLANSPCKRGHIPPLRYTSTSDCVECATQSARVEYSSTSARESRTDWAEWKERRELEASRKRRTTAPSEPVSYSHANNDASLLLLTLTTLL